RPGRLPNSRGRLMSLGKFGLGKIGLGALAALLAMTGGALALPGNWGTSFQPSVTPWMEQIESYHKMVLYIIIAVCIFVLVLLVWIVIRYNARANPVPSQV